MAGLVTYGSHKLPYQVEGGRGWLCANNQLYPKPGSSELQFWSKACKLSTFQSARVYMYEYRPFCEMLPVVWRLDRRNSFRYDCKDTLHLLNPMLSSFAGEGERFLCGASRM